MSDPSSNSERSPARPKPPSGIKVLLVVVLLLFGCVWWGNRIVGGKAEVAREQQTFYQALHGNTEAQGAFLVDLLGLLSLPLAYMLFKKT
jgi:hypothetical protein